MEQAQPGQVSGQLESLIQQAIQAGIPPQQILPLLSQLQNPSGGGIGGLSTQCLQAGVGSAASQAVTNPSLHSSAHQTGLGGIHGLQALSQQPTSMAAAVAQMSASQGTPAVHQATAQSQAQLPPGAVASSLPWPIFQPIVSVPHFDMATYEKVNLDVQPSALPNGQDLPLNDVNTLRFFFNFGVQHARAILLRQHLQSQQANVAQNPHLLSFLQNPDTALALQQQLLRAQQQAALLTGQRPGERPNLSQTTNQVPQQIPGLPGNLSMNSLQNTLAQHLARNFAPAQSSFKPVGASSNDPLETLLQSALLGANPAAAAQIKAAMASQGQGSFAVPSQPLGHHLTAQQHLASQAQHLEQLQHDLMRPHAINPALIGSHAANSTTNSIAGQTMMSTLASATSGTQTSHSNGGGGQVAVSPKNLPIPADPVPRKSSSVHGIQDQNYEQLQNLKLQGLMALRNPNPMNENLQKQIAAAANALTAGQPMAASAQNIVTNSTAPGHGITTTATVPVSSMPSLAAQLSAAMVAGTVFMPTSAGSVAMTNVSGVTSHAGLPTIANSNATRSLTYGSSGHQSAHGIPTSTPTSNTGTTNSSGIGIASIPITVAATSVRPTASSPSVPLEVDGTPTILAASEMHYSETFKKTQGLPVHGTRQSASPMSGSGETRRKSGLYSIMNTESKEDIKKTSSEKPPVTSMINYVNSYMSQAKSQLQAQGVGLHMDPAGRPIDYSSRPIDPIFRKAREKLEDVRAYHDTETPSAVQTGGSTTTSGGSTNSPPEAEAANPQRSSCLIGISSKKSDPKQESSVSVKTETTPKEEPQEQEDIKKEESSASESQKRDVYSYDDGSPEEKRLRIASTDDEGES